MTKMTYSVAIDYAISVINGEETPTEIKCDEVREKLEALKVQLAKRNSGTRKPTKAQRENAALKEDIWAWVSENGAKRASEVATYFGISGQKASALLTQLVTHKRLERFEEKRVAFFRVAEGQ